MTAPLAPSAASVALTLRAIRARGVHVPLRRPLHTSGGALTLAPLALIDLHTHEGVTGSTYLFCYTPLALGPVLQLIDQLGTLLQDQAVAPLEWDRALHQRFRLLGAKGVVGMALAGLDMAAWDTLARAHRLPLVRLLGAAPRALPAYNSCGLGLMGAERVAAQATELLERGLGAIKLRLGYPTLAEDLAAVRAVRRAVGDGITLMTDYNQGLSVAEAVRRCAALAEEDLCWVEEPTSADDNEGHARLRARSTQRIQIGENWWGPQEMAHSLAAGACDLGMPDAMKIGGVTGWQRAAALAHSAGLPLSSHLFPEVSAHLLAASPTCHWLEYVDWAEPVLQRPCRLADGLLHMDEEPGSGIAWNEDAVARFSVQP